MENWTIGAMMFGIAIMCAYTAYKVYRMGK